MNQILYFEKNEVLSPKTIKNEMKINNISMFDFEYM